MIFCDAVYSMDACSAGFPIPSPPNLAGSATNDLSLSLKGNRPVTAGIKVDRRESSRI